MGTQRGVFRRGGVSLLATALAITGSLALSSSAVSAADSSAFVSPVSASYTDSASPTKAFGGPSGPFRVGAWVDGSGGSHVSRAYFSFDLSQFKGATINTATLVADEASANDCDKPRQIALWQTATPAGKITWNNAPAQQKKVFSGIKTAPACPWSFIEWDATAVIRQDLAGTGIFTIEVSVPGNFAANPAFGRELNSLSVLLEYDHAPDVPTGLAVDGRPCAATPIFATSLRPRVTADLTDADGSQNQVSAEFQIWPVGLPDQTTTFDSDLALSPPTEAGTIVPDGVFTDGGKYVLRVRSNDGQLDSNWSSQCRVNVDVTGPTAAPTVTSTDYPEGTDFPGSGGPNVPGTFTFTANGDKSIVDFAYGEGVSPTIVAANKPGGTATATFTPTRSGFIDLDVRGVDRAGNEGPVTSYAFMVKDTSPTVIDANPGGAFRQPRTLTFSPNQDGVVTYFYELNGEGQQSVSADADGQAQVSVAPDQGDQNSLTVQSITADGILSGTATYFMFVDTTPTVTSAQYPSTESGGGIGIRGAFTFSPAYSPGVISYTYSFDNGVSQTVAANANGKATVHFTPGTSGTHILVVTSLDTTGFVSDQQFYVFDVNSNQPTITSDVYQNFTPSGGPGVPGTFTFTAHQTGATAFVYQFGSDAPQNTAAVGADGTATVTFTPPAAGLDILTVTTTDAAGRSSDATSYGVDVAPGT